MTIKPVYHHHTYIYYPELLIELSLHRLGSLLLDSLKEHISTTAQDHCKAIYLHVLTTNNTAIHFYENRDFRQHHYLPYYYSIRGVLKDGFTYVLYINGGHPPWTILYPFLDAGKESTYSVLLDTLCFCILHSFSTHTHPANTDFHTD